MNDAGSKKDRLAMMLQKESLTQSKTFAQEQKQITNDLQKQKLIKHMTQEEIQAIQASTTKDQCCSQCSLPMPLVCWRNKIRHDLIQHKIAAASSDETTKKHQYAEFHNVDGWRSDLDVYITQVGSEHADRQWKMGYSLFTRRKTDQQNAKMNKEKVHRVSQLESTLTNDQSQALKN